jgi:serine protease inhibitor
MTRTIYLALLLTACTHAAADPQTETPSSRVQPDSSSPPVDAPRPSADVRHDRYADANNAFGFDLWQQVRAHENLSIAPASISLALGMTWTGARGTTADEMSRVLHIGDTDAMVASMGQQLRAWNDPAREAYELRVVDRLFGEKTATFEADFLTLMKDSFGAPLEQVDFIRKWEPSRARINDWVEQTTKDRIVDLLPVGSLDADTRLVLTNAVYFKGDWQHAFEAGETHPQPFHVAGSTIANVPMMHQVAKLAYAKTDDLQIVELPYAGGELAFDVVLPATKDGLDALSAGLDDVRFGELVAQLQPTSVELALPKFKLEMPQSIALKKPLKQLGMTLAFEDGADFTGISKTISPLFIDDVFHKTFVAVDEEGTEAAAATAVVMKTESAAIGPEGTPFVADHPFVFVLRDVRSGTILFLGQLVDPR